MLPQSKGKVTEGELQRVRAGAMACMCYIVGYFWASKGNGSGDLGLDRTSQQLHAQFVDMPKAVEGTHF